MEAPLAGGGQHREQLIMASGPDVSHGLVLPGFQGGICGASPLSWVRNGNITEAKV